MKTKEEFLKTLSDLPLDVYHGKYELKDSSLLKYLEVGLVITSINRLTGEFKLDYPEGLE